MRLCCALLSLLGIWGALPGQVGGQIFEVGGALRALEDKVGAVPGDVQPVDRLERLLAHLLQRETLRLRGEALAVSREEALFGVQLVRGSLPEDRTVFAQGTAVRPGVPSARRQRRHDDGEERKERDRAVAELHEHVDRGAGVRQDRQEGRERQALTTR
jgi:hypothetical protein